MRGTLLKSKPVFEIKVPGKWILAGEHAVLRGSEALAFPLYSRYLKLFYFKNESNPESEFELFIEGENKQELELIIWSVLERAFSILNVKRSHIFGLVKIQSFIALGGGVGASATLCVALTEWLHFLGYIKNDEMFDFARNLENLFHGESSGVDVAVTLFKKPLVFTRSNGFVDLKISSMPALYLSYSGERGVTRDCIEKVKNLGHTQPELAKIIDQEMQEAVLDFKKLLTESNTSSGWIKAVEKSNHCFEQWGLVTENVKKHQNQLLDAGALAVKLTGSGGGGYVLSLWESKPAIELPFEIMDCFE